MMSEAQKTPAAKWRQEGEVDPHGDHYSCQRAALTLGEYTDDELANGVFLHGNEPLNINAVVRKTPGYHPAVIWLTAGKDRIRWLSRALEESKSREQALQLLLNDRDEQLNNLEQSSRSHFENAQAAERRIDKLTSKTVPDTAVCRGSTALGTACGKCVRCLAPLGEVKFKGMIETACGTFAIMIDEANGHYGWTFQRHPDGMWVSGRKATEAEMSAARAHAKLLALF
jgi:bacterioferritin-associated ferredoxin